MQATYIPAMLGLAVNHTKTGSRDERTHALSAMLRYLARVLTLQPGSLDGLPAGVTVLERNVIKIKDGVTSDEFKTDPDLLEQTPLPEDEVANLDRPEPASNGGLR